MYCNNDIHYYEDDCVFFISVQQLRVLYTFSYRRMHNSVVQALSTWPISIYGRHKSRLIESACTVISSRRKHHCSPALHGIMVLENESSIAKVLAARIVPFVSGFYFATNNIFFSYSCCFMGLILTTGWYVHC